MGKITPRGRIQPTCGHSRVAAISPPTPPDAIFPPTGGVCLIAICTALHCDPLMNSAQHTIIFIDGRGSDHHIIE